MGESYVYIWEVPYRKSYHTSPSKVFVTVAASSSKEARLKALRQVETVILNFIPVGHKRRYFDSKGMLHKHVSKSLVGTEALERMSAYRFHVRRHIAKDPDRVF